LGRGDGRVPAVNNAGGASFRGGRDRFRVPVVNNGGRAPQAADGPSGPVRCGVVGRGPASGHRPGVAGGERTRPLGLGGWVLFLVHRRLRALDLRPAGLKGPWPGFETAPEGCLELGLLPPLLHTKITRFIGFESGIQSLFDRRNVRPTTGRAPRPNSHEIAANPEES